MRVLLLFYVIACTADAAYPQSRIPGPSFDASRLHAAVDTFVSVSVNAGRSDTIGWATQSLRRADFGGRDSWVQVYRWHGRDGVQSSDSLVVDAHSLPLIKMPNHDGYTLPEWKHGMPRPFPNKP